MCADLPPSRADPGAAVPFTHLEVPALRRQGLGHVRVADAVPAQEVSFSDARAWRAFFVAHGLGEAYPVDFERLQVAAVFLGPANAGRGVEITRVDRATPGPGVIVHVTEWLPNPELVDPAVLVHPNDVVSFPRSPGPVRFVRTARLSGT